LLFAEQLRSVATLDGRQTTHPNGRERHLALPLAMYWALPRHCVPPIAQHALTHRAAEGEKVMIYYAFVFLELALVAGTLGVSGVAAVATQIAWVLFVIGLILMLPHFIAGRRTLAP
jgi:uncharacterized membrane protein YtjA (UPF0391 family)